MERFVCIHGHFYQPPRENPWLETIEIQDSAHPYHDWNERITAECYAPNSASRILNSDRQIIDIVSNYTKISFNFGPTLLSWMETFSPDAYQAVLEADRISVEKSGHGNAIAQAYNHLIMPLAVSRDKRTQILWGIRDFETRFKRFPEGMWLPETAVDLETLELLAEQGIRFTILSPHQARRVRPLAAGKWRDLGGSQIDPTRSYLCRLRSGRAITIFFYDGPISRAVAFERLLSRGEVFANRILGGFNDDRKWAQLMHIATDGETYGHHHHFGDMGLAYALQSLEEERGVCLTNYGSFLELYPPTNEVEIIENSSWSCIHGVERWRSDCGCNSGGNGGWNQKWRAPLRLALDWLRDELAVRYEKKAGSYLYDPWKARDDYIDVVLNRTADKIEAFFEKHSPRRLDREERSDAIRLLELQRHAMLMYTSCGWFFDELSGIETVQVMQYAGRAMQLAKDCFGENPESGFLDRLAEAKSNVQELGDGRGVYERFVRPAVVDLRKVAAHYGISSLFAIYEQRSRIFSYMVSCEDHEELESGRARLALGKVSISSDITGESETVSFGVVHLGDHVLNCGVGVLAGNAAHRAMKHELSSAFTNGDFTATLRGLDRHFGARTYSLKDLFRDEQRKVLRRIIGGVLDDFENAYRGMYYNSRALMGFLQETGMPVPRGFTSAAEFILNLDLKRAFWAERIDPDQVRTIMANVRRWQTPIDSIDVEFSFRRRVNALMTSVQKDPLRTEAMASLNNLLHVLQEVPLEINLWQAQNLYHQMTAAVYPDMAAKSRAGDGTARQWAELFLQLGRLLHFDTDAVLPRGPKAEGSD